MSLALRPARSTDAGAVGAILSEFIDGTQWMPRVHTRAEVISHAGTLIDRGWVTVAETKMGVVAFSAFDGELVHALYVAEGYQSDGIGSALHSRLKDANLALTLWTFQENHGAQRFYARHGFVEVERTDGTGNDENLPDIKLHWMRESKDA